MVAHTINNAALRIIKSSDEKCSGPKRRPVQALFAEEQKWARRELENIDQQTSDAFRESAHVQLMVNHEIAVLYTQPGVDFKSMLLVQFTITTGFT